MELGNKVFNSEVPNIIEDMDFISDNSIIVLTKYSNLEILKINISKNKEEYDIIEDALYSSMYVTMDNIIFNTDIDEIIIMKIRDGNVLRSNDGDVIKTDSKLKACSDFFIAYFIDQWTLGVFNLINGNEIFRIRNEKYSVKYIAL